MPSYTDQKYLKDEQYKDASNLNARILIHRLFSENQYGWAPWVFDLFETLPQKANVLELGSGPAFIWTQCSERIPAEWQITLSDLSPGMLAAAQKSLASVEHEFTYREIDAQEIPFDDASFDIVIANHMLYHVPDRPKALAEIKRVLKDDGVLIAATNGDNHLAELNAWLEIATVGDDFTPMSNPFTLDNGMAQLEPYFSSIELLRYEDNLHITDLDLMMKYVRSVITVKGFPDANLEKVETLLEKELAEKGEIFIQKDSGVFRQKKLPLQHQMHHVSKTVPSPINTQEYKPALLTRETKLGILFIVLISALVYLPYALKLTYHLDDWYYIYDGIIYGPNIFHPMFKVDRPLRGYFFDVYFSLLGPGPLLYHISFYLWRLVAALGAFGLFNLLWKNHKKFNFYIALLFALFPGFTWWVSAIEYQPMIASLAIQVLSFAFTLRAISTNNIFEKLFFIAGAIISGWVYIGLVEYAIGMEIFRLLIIYIFLKHEKTKNISAAQDRIHLFKIWAWNLLIPLGFIYWRIFFFTSERKATDITLQLENFSTSPISFLKNSLNALIESVLNLSVHVWLKQLPINLARTGTNLSMGWLLLFGVFLLTIAVIYLLNNNPKPGKKVLTESLFLASISLFFGILPVILFNRFVNLSIYSHYGLPASLASVLLLVSLIFLIPSKNIQSILLVLFILTSALTNVLVAEKTLDTQKTLGTFWWQVSWRIPALRPDTTLVTVYPVMDVVDNYEMGLLEPPNLIYFSEPQDAIPLREPVATLIVTDWNIDSVLAHQGRETFKYRTQKAVVNYDNYLVLSQPTLDSCVRVVNGNDYILSQNNPTFFSKIANLSEINNVRSQREHQLLPEYAFGKEPDYNWCYFFEKADLAIQNLNWSKAAHLGDEAISQNLMPMDNAEWYPLIQAYAMTGNEAKLTMIAQQTDEDSYFQHQVCETVQRPASVLSIKKRKEIIEKLFCK